MEQKRENLSLIAENQRLKIELQDNDVKYLNLQRVFVALIVTLYITITIAAVAIITSNKQEVELKSQTESILYLTSELIVTKQTLAEIDSDSRMIQELQRVGKPIGQ
jgi:hypothetical protein